MVTNDYNLRAVRELIKTGLTFGEAIAVFAEDNDETAEKYIAAAREFAEEGAIEIDDATITSGSGDAGDYVLAWVWVTNDEAGIGPEDDENEEATA